ncbi:MAG: KpsF/GutQ family sugar-phosphate isomerase [Thermodesulfobacteriota bacterium]
MSSDEIKKIARRVLGLEAAAVTALAEKIDDDFVKAVEIILASTGKVVVTGMGKSGLICQKVASTLASTGTSAFFLHPAEGVHGDLGMIMRNDVLLAMSNSGETEEILKIMPAVKRLGTLMIVMTGKAGSSLASYGDAVLDIGVAEEACPLGLSPTSSTTAALAMGDALAVALLEKRGFKAEDFATLHPAGSLGKRLMKVEDLMHSGDSVPRVNSSTPMKEAVLEMTRKRLGITGVFDEEKLIGAITDGDLRRELEKGNNVFDKCAKEVMTESPKTIDGASLVEAALNIMDENSITSLFVTDSNGAIKGIVHLHDLIKAGVL